MPSKFQIKLPGILHDLSNPLTVLSLSLEELKKNHGIRSTKIRRHIETADRASKRIGLFLAMARKQMQKVDNGAPFDVHRETQGVIGLLRAITRRAQAQIKLRSPRAVFVFGDQVKFFRVISNLVSNALDSYAHCPSISTRGKIVMITITENKRNVTVKIRDYGCGIPTNSRKKIFEPFYTTKGSSGLGLSIVKNIIEKDFGGKVRVKSSTGKGSLFSIILPKSKSKETLQM